jgi:hypothetical protein
VSEKSGYKNGMAQPAILILRGGKGGDNTGEETAILEKWAIVPSTMNLGGASDRPDLEQVWDNARAKFEGKGVVHGTYKRMRLLNMLYKRFFG